MIADDRTRRRHEQRLLERERRLSSLRALADRVASALRDLPPELGKILQESSTGENPAAKSKMSERIRHLETLARSLALFSGRFSESASPTSVSVGDLLERAVNESLNGARLPENTLRRGSLRVDCRSQTGLWPVMAEEEALRDAFLEVLRNGWEAMPEGGTLTVRASNLRLDDDPGALPPGPYVEVQVTDTGVGIESSQVEHIFDPFYSTKPRDRALGVGLSLAFGIIRGHGGDLRVESQPGKGPTVRILVPAER